MADGGGFFGFDTSLPAAAGGLGSTPSSGNSAGGGLGGLGGLADQLEDLVPYEVEGVDEKNDETFGDVDAFAGDFDFGAAAVDPFGKPDAPSSGKQPAAASQAAAGGGGATGLAGLLSGSDPYSLSGAGGKSIYSQGAFDWSGSLITPDQINQATSGFGGTSTKSIWASVPDSGSDDFVQPAPPKVGGGDALGTALGGLSLSDPGQQQQPQPQQQSQEAPPASRDPNAPMTLDELESQLTGAAPVILQPPQQAAQPPQTLLQAYLQSKDPQAVVARLQAEKGPEQTMALIAEAVQHALQGPVDVIATLFGAMLEKQLLEEASFTSGFLTACEKTTNWADHAVQGNSVHMLAFGVLSQKLAMRVFDAGPLKALDGQLRFQLLLDTLVTVRQLMGEEAMVQKAKELTQPLEAYFPGDAAALRDALAAKNAASLAPPEQKTPILDQLQQAQQDQQKANITAGLQQLEQQAQMNGQAAFQAQNMAQQAAKALGDLQRQCNNRPDEATAQRLGQLQRELQAHSKAAQHHGMQIQQIRARQMHLQRALQQASLPPPANEQEALMRDKAHMQGVLEAITHDMNRNGAQLDGMSKQIHALMPKAATDEQAKAALANLHAHHRHLLQAQGALAKQRESAASRFYQIDSRLAALSAASRPPPGKRPPEYYNNLMTASEKQWLVRVQLKQLQTENPYVDDFYFQTYMSDKAAAEGKERAPSKRFVPGSKPFKYHSDSSYKPVKFDDTLGSIRASSVQAPKQMIGVVSAEREADPLDPANKATRLLSLRRKALLAIEHGYQCLLDTEDIDRRTQALPKGRRGEWLVKKGRLVASAMKALAVENGSQLLARILVIPKGLAMVGRLQERFAKAQGLAFYAAVGTLLTDITSGGLFDDAPPLPDNQAEALMGLLSRPLAGALDQYDLGDLLHIAKAVVDASAATPARKKGITSQFGATFLYYIIRKADTLLPTAQPDQQRAWVENMDVLGKSHSGTFHDVIAATEGVSPLWDLLTVIAAHSSPAGKTTLKEALGGVIPAEGSATFSPSVGTFCKILG